MRTIDERKTLQNGQRVQLYTRRNNWGAAGGVQVETVPYCKAYYLADYDGFQKRKGARRYMYPSNFSHFEVVGESKAKSWAGEWGRVARTMKKHGINTTCASLIERNIEAGEEAMKDLALRMASYDDNKYYADVSDYDARQELREQLLTEWAEARAGLGYTSDNVYDHMTLGTQNYPMRGLPRIVKVNIRPEYVENALEAVKSGKSEKDRAENWQSMSRDFSVSVHKHTGENSTVFTTGEVRAYYASEYKNCGNGAYYMLMSPTQAWHMEND